MLPDFFFKVNRTVKIDFYSLFTYNNLPFIRSLSISSIRYSIEVKTLVR